VNPVRCAIMSRRLRRSTLAERIVEVEWEEGPEEPPLTVVGYVVQDDGAAIGIASCSPRPPSDWQPSTLYIPRGHVLKVTELRRGKR
jgi:hypothetical protein